MNPYRTTLVHRAALGSFARLGSFGCLSTDMMSHRPTLVSPTDALANIEQYAIDLAWDIIARFADAEVDGERLPVEFFLDWAKVAEDEAKHYSLLAKRLHVSLSETLRWPAVRSSVAEILVGRG